MSGSIQTNRLLRPAAALALAIAAGPGLAAQAGIVWQDNFTGETAGAPSQDYNGDSLNDWTTAATSPNAVVVSTSIGNAAPALHFDDTGSGEVNAKVAASGFEPFAVDANSATQAIRVTFDWNIASLSGGSNFSPRFHLRDGNTSRVTIGFNSGSNIDTDTGSDLFFAYGTDSLNAPNVIGYDAGTDSWWNDFGNTADTTSSGGWVNVEVLLDTSSDLATITLTKGENSVVVQTAVTASAFAHDGSNDYIEWRTGNGQGSQTYVDNIVVETVAIPEPASLAVVGLAALGMTARRRRRS